MYRHILVAIEHSDSDEAILRHVEQLARLTGASLLLVHVADGWAARHFDDLELRESEEMRADREYLQRLVAQLNAAGLPAEGRLALGDPATELIRTARQESVDLVAMATHGHRWLNDLLRGTTVNRVRHELTVPVLLVRGGAIPP
jgi:nucleotide-binding universal stress UspA family protein